MFDLVLPLCIHLPLTPSPWPQVVSHLRDRCLDQFSERIWRNTAASLPHSWAQNLYHSRLWTSVKHHSYKMPTILFLGRTFKMKRQGLEVMAQQLKVCTVLLEDLSSVPSPTSGGLQPPGTSVTVDLMASSGLCDPVRTYVCTYVYTHTPFFKK